jgi:hypothetical protein
MAKLNVTKRIVTEDFQKDDQALVSKLAFTLNSFFEQTANALNKNLTIEDNLNMEVKSVTITVDASGIPTTAAAFQTALKTKVRGATVIAARNQTSATTYPTSAPFLTFEQNDGIITIQHIAGLQASNSYSLTILLYG